VKAILRLNPVDFLGTLIALVDPEDLRRKAMTAIWPD
jgi:hypothetical protein